MADKVAFQAPPMAEPMVAPTPLAGVLPVPSRDPEDHLVTDGLPMADSDVQAVTMRDAHYMLEHYFHQVKRDPSVYVAIDTFVHYQGREGNEKLAPDVMVVSGVGGHRRDSYDIETEGGRAPDFVLEVLSRSTHLTDQTRKREQYARMGVREYFQYDPKGTTLRKRAGHRLQGEQFRGGRWTPLERQGAERVCSEVLGLELRVKRRETEPGYRELRFRNPRTGADLPTYNESQERATREAARANAERAAREREAARAEEAEQKNAELEALLAEMRGGIRSHPSTGS